MLAPWKKSYDQTRQHIQKERHYFANNDLSSQSYGFSSSHVWVWELSYKESWVLKNWCFWTVVLEKTLENPLDSKEIQPFHPKGNQSWIFIERTDAEADTPILWPPDAKKWLIWKDPDAGKDWRQEEKGLTEDDTVLPTQGTWVWINSGSWQWTGRPGMLQFLGLQRVGHDWVTELRRQNTPRCLRWMQRISRRNDCMEIWGGSKRKRMGLRQYIWKKKKKKTRILIGSLPHGTGFHWKSEVVGGILWLVDCFQVHFLSSTSDFLHWLQYLFLQIQFC